MTIQRPRRAQQQAARCRWRQAWRCLARAKHMRRRWWRQQRQWQSRDGGGDDATMLDLRMPVMLQRGQHKQLSHGRGSTHSNPLQRRSERVVGTHQRRRRPANAAKPSLDFRQQRQRAKSSASTPRRPPPAARAQRFSVSARAQSKRVLFCKRSSITSLPNQHEDPESTHASSLSSALHRAASDHIALSSASPPACLRHH